VRRVAVIIILISAQLLAQNFADDEAPGVQPDGVVQFFRLQRVPIVASVKVYRNGIRQTRGLDFAVYPGGAFPRVGFFPCCIPQTGDILRFEYRY
jgi:hypothetical protein